MKALFLTLLAATSLASAAPPSIEDFQRPPAFSGPKLSPDGRHVAAIINPDGKTTSLAVIATDKPGEAIPIKAFGEADIQEIYWIDNERLAFTVQPRVDGEGWYVSPGLWTLNRDGSGFKQWVNPMGGGRRGGTLATRMLNGNWSLFQPPSPHRPDELILRQYLGDKQGFVRHVHLSRLDPRTSERRQLTLEAPDEMLDWVVDANGQPAFAFGSNGRGGSRVMWRTPEGSWALWHETEEEEPTRRPLAIDRAGRLYLSINENGRSALHRADSLAPDAPSTRLLASATHDIRAWLLRDADSDQLLGAQFETDVPQSAWYSREMAEAQAEIDARLPGAANGIQCQRCLAVPTLLVTSTTDRRPPRYFLFDRATRQLTPLAASMPWIPQGRPRRTASTAARDGLRLPMIVTHPGTPGPAPTVLLVHGGPWVRGNHWAWDAEAQFYASRGYLVLEVDFRGSEGYGARHLSAGYKQWGLKMQDDLDDALVWAVKQGLADPKRVCIVGASYGGYAALMGLARGGISCAVAALAPTDLTKLISRHWSDAAAESLTFSLPKYVGDAQADAALLRDNSPIRLVDKLQGPLLLAYGERDERVPLAHGIELRDALTAAGRPPEFVAYPNEGHGFYKWEHRQDHWRRIEAFLARHLAPPN